MLVINKTTKKVEDININAYLEAEETAEFDPQAFVQGSYDVPAEGQFIAMKYNTDPVIVDVIGEGYLDINDAPFSHFILDENHEWIDPAEIQTLNWQQPSTQTEYEIPLSTADINGASTRMPATFATLPDAIQPYTFSNGVTVLFNKEDWDDLVQKVHSLLNP